MILFPFSGDDDIIDLRWNFTSDFQELLLTSDVHQMLCAYQDC